MPGKNYANIVNEVTYGTPPATGWQGLAVADDGHKPNVLISQPQSIIYGAEGPSTLGRQADARDAQGTLKTWLASAGLLKLFRATFGAPVTTELAAGEAYQHVFSTSALASTFSVATQIGRTFKDGTADRDTFAGGMVKEFRLNQAKAPAGGGVSDDALAKLEYDLDYQRMLPPGDFAQKLPTYPVPELYFGVGALTVSIGESLEDLTAECLESLSFKYTTGIDTDDTCISSLVKDKPTRGELPTGTMDGAWAYKARGYYDTFLSGGILALRAKYEPAALEISEDIKPSVTIDVAAFGFTGDAPQMERNAKTKQALPMEILHNGTDPMITATVITSDATV